MSARLHFVVEGQTEETYVNRVLKPHLADFGVWADARCVETGRKRGLIGRGGMCEYRKLRNDLVRWMKQDDHPEVFFTTMIDLYGLDRLEDEFPEGEEAARIPDPYQKVAAMETALKADIDHPRFIPYLQLHEFEALLLASPGHLLAEFVGHDREIAAIESMANGFASPELINEGRQTAPSKRIISELPQYEGMKTSAGPLVAEKIGLETLRTKCRHFADWLSRLETLGATPSL
jgi:hypothetical protein